MKATDSAPSRNRRVRGPGRSRVRQRSDDANAFFADPEGGPVRAPDDLAEEMAEEFVQAATSGESQSEDALNADVSEEIGGPFVETLAGEELASGVDASNPIDAQREALPRAVAGLAVNPGFAKSWDEDRDTLVEGQLDDDEEIEPAQSIDVRADRHPSRPPHPSRR